MIGRLVGGNAFVDSISTLIQCDGALFGLLLRNTPKIEPLQTVQLS